MGHSRCRCVCDLDQLEVQCFLLPCRPLIPQQWSSLPVDVRIPLPFPSTTSGVQGPAKDTKLKTSLHPIDPLVAKATMVSTSTQSGGYPLHTIRCFGPPLHSRADGVFFDRQGPEADSLIDPALTFSGEIRHVLLNSRKQSTRKSVFPLSFILKACLL